MSDARFVKGFAKQRSDKENLIEVDLWVQCSGVHRFCAKLGGDMDQLFTYKASEQQVPGVDLNAVHPVRQDKISEAHHIGKHQHYLLHRTNGTHYIAK